MIETQWDLLISFLTHSAFASCIFRKSLCGDNEFAISSQIRRRRCKGRGESVRGEKGLWGRGADMSRLSWGLDFICDISTQGMDRRQAGLHGAVALVTYSSEAKGTHRRQQNSLCSKYSSLSLSLSLTSTPSLLRKPLFLSSISSFHSLPLSNKTWPPARWWCHGCHGDGSLAATGLCGEGEVRGKGNYGSLMKQFLSLSFDYKFENAHMSKLFL